MTVESLPRRVFLYQREGCHLCHDVLRDLQLLQAEMDLVIEEVDITQDPVLLNRYRLRIPVVEIDGGPRLLAPIDIQQLREALA